MTWLDRIRLSTWVIAGVVLTSGLGTGRAVHAQDTAAAGVPVAETQEKLSDEELDELVAPIALHPDVLVAQILPASAYPLEIVQAQRFLDDHGGKADEETINNLEYDVSILALMHYPTVVKKMSDSLDWTMQLGDAVVAQQEDVMAAIQRVRGQAQAAENLQTNDRMTVVQEKEIIQIVPSDPTVIYVPQYDPTVIVVEDDDNDWEALWSFGAGVAVGGWLNYGCNWHHGRVDIDVHGCRRYWGGVRPGWVPSRVWHTNRAHRAAYRHGTRAGRRAGYRAGATAGARTGAAAGRRTGAAAGARTGAAAGRRTGTAAGARKGVQAGARTGAAAGRRTGAAAGARKGAQAGARTRAAAGARTGKATGRSAYGGYRSGSSARRHSARGARSRGGGRRR